MRDELEAASGLRFLFGEPSFIRSIEKEGTQSRQFTLGDQGLALANQLSQKKLAKDCAAWIANQVEIRSIVRKGFLHGKMYHIRNRLLRLTADSPNLLAIIKAEGKV